MSVHRCCPFAAAFVLLAAACDGPDDRQRERAPARPAVSEASSAGLLGAGANDQPRYRPPVSAPVLDGFRPPPGPFAAGNRGIEYETSPGTPVGAIAAGRVVFAGSVGGSRHVTVLHADGLRSSYSFLETIEVAVDDRILAGQSVGRSTSRLHLGVRAGAAYLDPALLFGAGRVHLVPVR